MVNNTVNSEQKLWIPFIWFFQVWVISLPPDEATRDCPQETEFEDKIAEARVACKLLRNDEDYYYYEYEYEYEDVEEDEIEVENIHRCEMIEGQKRPIV